MQFTKKENNDSNKIIHCYQSWNKLYMTTRIIKQLVALEVSLIFIEGLGICLNNFSVRENPSIITYINITSIRNEMVLFFSLYK